MSQYDDQYNRIISKIMRYGETNKDEQVRTRWESGNTPAYTKSIISQKMRFDNSEVPILTTKKVAWRTSIKELLWIWQLKSNDVNVLNDMGVHIWDQWRQLDKTIGKSYGFQLGKECRLVKTTEVRGGLNDEIIYKIDKKVDQVDYLLYQLKHNPYSRRHVTSLWNIDDLDEMALQPCIWNTQWHVKNGKLHLEVRARSNDMAIGNPFNVFQYNVLQRMFAQVLGYELGEFIFDIGDCHAYDRHLDKLEEQIKRPTYPAPTLWINPEVKNFYDFTIDDFELIDYQHGDKISYEVAI